MQLLEHQAKELLKKAGAATPDGFVSDKNDGVEDHGLAFPVVLKSQVPVGGRGKLGGIKLVRSREEFEKAFVEIMALEIKGHLPTSLLVEQAVNIGRELYLSLRVNRDTRRVEYLVSSHGGVDIESSPELVMIIPPEEANYRQKIAETLQLPLDKIGHLLDSLERCFYDNDCLLLEINPLALVADENGQKLICADAKISVDDNARFRHPEMPWQKETAIKPLGGTIGVIANGAGMAMSTMDAIYAAGARPANFLDIGGGTGEDVFIKNLRQITQLPGVTSIIINIFAGITRCDDIARGIIAAKREIPGLVPLYIRLEGTRRDEATELLREANIELQPDLKTCIEHALQGEGRRKKEEGSTTKAETVIDSSDMPLKRVTQKGDAPTETKSVDFGEDGANSVAGPASSDLRSEAYDGSGQIFANQPVLIQGITGHHGAFHTKGMIDAGTNIVAGVTPGKGGETVHDILVYNSIKEAVEKHAATTSVIFVPARFAKDAMLEAIEAGIKLIVCITEGIPVHDMIAIRTAATKESITIVGPNCPGLIIPGLYKLGIIAAGITKPGNVALISRSGTLTYELADALSKKNIGQSIILGIGGDPIQGANFVEALEICQNDPRTERVIIVGEIGGETEQMAADFIENNVTKPVYGLVVGHSLPAGQTFGHAGAIVGSRGESASEKTTYMASKGIHMSETLDELILKL